MKLLRELDLLEHAHEPTFSADGSAIAFGCVTMKPPHNGRMVVVDIDGSERLSIPTKGFVPRLSTDGSRLAFLADHQNAKHTTGAIDPRWARLVPMFVNFADGELHALAYPEFLGMEGLMGIEIVGFLDAMSVLVGVCDSCSGHLPVVYNLDAGADEPICMDRTHSFDVAAITSGSTNHHLGETSLMGWDRTSQAPRYFAYQAPKPGVVERTPKLEQMGECISLGERGFIFHDRGRLNQYDWATDTAMTLMHLETGKDIRVMNVSDISQAKTLVFSARSGPDGVKLPHSGLFELDVESRATRRVDLTEAGEVTDGNVGELAISADGRHALFTSDTTTLGASPGRPLIYMVSLTRPV